MKPTSSDRPIWDVWLAAFHAPTLAIADELGVFSALAPAPATSDALAETLQIEPRATESMLGLLAALGLLDREGAAFALNDVARTYLLPTSQYYWGGFLRRIRTIPIDCNRLVDALRRGRAAQDARVSGALWRAPQPPPEALVGFTHAMHSHSFALARRVVASFGLSNASRLLDVAGGSGSYSIAAALELPDLHATVLDLAAVCDVTRSYAATHGVGDRVAAIAGDMFGDAPWPSGATDIFFSDIFHDWDDERCAYLARRAYDALAPGGRILVHEMNLDETKDGPLNAIAYSMVMVFVTEGRQRTVEELFAILRGAGFAAPQQLATAEGYRLISAAR